MILKDFNETFEAELEDPEFAALYLKAALQDNGMEGFLLALRNVMQTARGMDRISANAAFGRDSLYQTLSESGNPPFSTVQELLSALGLQLSVEPAQVSSLTSD
ncbi:MAG: addiction module antidote protein [Thermosynechococcaceae cyanobacterium]